VASTAGVGFSLVRLGDDSMAHHKSEQNQGIEIGNACFGVGINGAG
jgi:hypothetical protein